VEPTDSKAVLSCGSLLLQPNPPNRIYRMGSQAVLAFGLLVAGLMLVAYIYLLVSGDVRTGAPIVSDVNTGAPIRSSSAAPLL
jgi:hypothetical protein